MDTRGIGEVSVLSTQFCCEHKAVLKIKSVKQQQCGWHKDGFSKTTFVVKENMELPRIQEEGSDQAHAGPSLEAMGACFV